MSPSVRTFISLRSTAKLMRYVYRPRRLLRMFRALIRQDHSRGLVRRMNIWSSTAAVVELLEGRHAFSVIPGLAAASVPPIPALDQWRQNMISYGRMHAQFFADNAGKYSDPALAATYYDAIYVYLQIAQYLQDPTFLAAAKNAASIYRDLYVLPNNGSVPAYWNFTHGLALDYVLNRTPASLTAISDLVNNAAFSRSTTNDNDPAYPLDDPNQMREVARTLAGYEDADALGIAHPDREAALLTYAENDVKKVFVTQTAQYIKPLYFGHLDDALIEYAQVHTDPAVIQALVTIADGLWDTMWDRTAAAFKYSSIQIPNDDPPGPAPDLNLFVLPVYGYLWHITGDPRFLERGDIIFASGVQKAYLAGSKQFNQNYYQSIRYVQWRSEPPTPRVLAASVAYEGAAHVLSFQLSGPVTDPHDAGAVLIRNLDSGQILTATAEQLGADLATLRFTLPASLPDGRYEADLLSSAVQDAYGQHLDGSANGTAANFPFRFSSLTGDVNGDGSVGFADLLLLSQHYGQNGAPFADGDVTHDGKVDFADLLVIARAFGRSVGTLVTSQGAGTVK